jgi:hypothetical protein
MEEVAGKLRRITSDSYNRIKLSVRLRSTLFASAGSSAVSQTQE